MDSTSLQKPDKSTNGRTHSEYKREIVWKNVFAHLVLHLMGLYGLYIFIVSAKLVTWAYGELIRNILYIYIYTQLIYLKALFQAIKLRSVKRSGKAAPEF
jgi:hypothetical protein